MKLRLTKNDAQEVLHKLGVLADEPELQEEYGLTQPKTDALLASVPTNGGEWTIAGELELAAVRGEMQDHALVLHDIADDARAANDKMESRRIRQQARRFEKAFK